MALLHALYPFIMDELPNKKATPSSLLARSALAGLLCAGLSACSSSNQTSSDPHVTSSRVIEGMTAERFQTLCDARHGTVEVMAHCAGLATARGFSYDVETQALSEHTCKGANTCGGWNCVTDDPG